MTTLTQTEVQRLFDYNPATGVVTRKITTSSRARAGDRVGYPNNYGYLQVKIFWKQYHLHRIIWLWVHGKFPSDQIDHINHITSDNRLVNLREVTHKENHRNESMQCNNSSGISGVYWNKARKKWHARIVVSQTRIDLGYHESLDGAAAARKVAETKYGFHENHGKAA